MFMYHILQGFLRLVVSVFFRNLAIVGRENIPENGAIIFAGNHPNSLLDPVLVITQSGRTVHFAAKDILFKSRFLRFFLKNLGAVPIKRKMDHKDGKQDNRGAFDALCDVLRRGGAMGIFPEGISHTRSELADLKTGTARIAFQVNTRRQGDSSPQETPIPVYIVPVGLTYLHRQRFRSQVLIHFGTALHIDAAWQQRYEESPREASRSLTEELENRLRGLTINAPDWDTLRFIHTARRIYKPKDTRLSLAEYAELTRRFVEGYARHEGQDEIKKLRLELEIYQQRLEQLHLQDHELRRSVIAGSAVKRILWRILYLTVLFPLALPGFLLHAPVASLAVVAGDGMTVRKDVVATTKLVVSILLVPLIYATVTLLIGLLINWKSALLVLAILPLTGFATIRVLEQQFAIGQSITSLWRLFRFQREVEALRALRGRLEIKLNLAVDRFHDPTQPRVIDKLSEFNAPHF